MSSNKRTTEVSRPATSGSRRAPSTGTGGANQQHNVNHPTAKKPTRVTKIAPTGIPNTIKPQGGTGESNKVTPPPSDRVNNPTVVAPKGGSDQNANVVMRTQSPLFLAKSEDELDKKLQAALDRSMGLLKDEDPNYEGVQIVACDGHPPQWKEFLDKELLCDCIIESKEGETFRGHRCILSASVPFFQELFDRDVSPIRRSSSGASEGTPHRHRLQNVDSDSLQAIIDFAYTGSFTKDVDTIEKLLPIAYKYKILPIMQQCCQHLMNNLRPDNALRIYGFGKNFMCDSLEDKTKKFILNNFRFVVNYPEFLELTTSQLTSLLRDDHLNARNEAMVFEALRSWVEHDPDARKKDIPALLSCVRFGLMSYGYFTNCVYQWRFVEEDEAVRQALYAPSILLTSIDSLNNSEVDLNDPLARPRVPYEVIFAIGGWSAGSPTSFMETYDVRADRWFLMNNTDTTPRAYHGLVTLGTFIYMIGGFDGQEHFSTVKRYDPIEKVWEVKSCMLNPRCYVSCCALDGKIYACGGYNGRTRMNSAEMYTPEQNQWEMIPPMNRQRSDASAAAIKGKIYVAGGFTGSEVLNSVETYDPKENQWTFIHPMNTARSGVALVAYRDQLYAIGGFNGFSRLNTAERFDPEESGPWRMIPEMSSARSNFAAVCADELLICIGGFNGSTTIPYVECYDSKVNEWFDASHMNLNRSALSACVVINLPNAQEYSYLQRVQELMGGMSTNLNIAENEAILGVVNSMNLQTS